MQTTTILFDLDGTLLPMDYHVFLKLYCSELGQKGAQLGFAPKPMLDALWLGVAQMARNEGPDTNADVFWTAFSQTMGRDLTDLIPAFDRFYCEEFHRTFAACRENPAAKPLLAELRRRGARLVLATNPQFPLCAVQTRLGWIGLSSDDFDLVTTYETSHASKPNPKYYLEILQKIGQRPEACVMIGNDIREDILPTASLGMRNYLVTDWMLGELADAGDVPHGNFSEMSEWVLKLFPSA